MAMNKQLWEIGQRVVDEDGNHGIVCIVYSDGDICEYENDAAHPNPRPLADLLKGEREMIQVICADCGHVWMHPVVIGGKVVCPKCNGEKINVAIAP